MLARTSLCGLYNNSTTCVSLPHRSMVAWCIGVEATALLMAVNGPVFRDCIKSPTRTLELLGLLQMDSKLFETGSKIDLI